MPPLLLLAEAAALALALEGPPGAEDYYWFKRGGTYVGHGAVPYDVPTELSKPPAWKWDNPNDEINRHGPVIDGKKNIYAATGFGTINKFSPDGEILWSHSMTREESRVVTSPFLYKGRLYINSMGTPFAKAHLIHCFDMETGKRLWVRPGPAGRVNLDSHTVHAAEDVLLGAMIDESTPNTDMDGNNKIWAVNATDGGGLWDFTIGANAVVWNFMPSTPGDGTFIFSTQCGVAQRRRLIDGSLIWKSEIEEPGNWCSTGGGTLGPNGVFYIVTKHVWWSREGSGGPPAPGVADCDLRRFGRCPEGPGIIVAHNAEDGKILWARRILPEFGGGQYPAVGKVGGVLRLVAGIGENPASPNPLWGPRFVPKPLRTFITWAQLRSSLLRRLTFVPVRRNAVATFDVDTGKLIWMFEEPAWDYDAAAGDEPDVLRRISRQNEDPRVDAACVPDNWGIPVVTGDGTILMGSGCNGNLYAIRDKNGDGEIQPEDVSTFKTGNAFLNGPAVAPGLMAFAPCWGPMYVFKS